jgi:hypothetical protein
LWGGKIPTLGKVATSTMTDRIGSLVSSTSMAGGGILNITRTCFPTGASDAAKRHCRGFGFCFDPLEAVSLPRPANLQGYFVRHNRHRSYRLPRDQVFKGIERPAEIRRQMAKKVSWLGVRVEIRASLLRESSSAPSLAPLAMPERQELLDSRC